MFMVDFLLELLRNCYYDSVYALVHMKYDWVENYLFFERIHEEKLIIAHTPVYTRYDSKQQLGNIIYLT